MPTIVARHQVLDINAWLHGHQERVDLFAPAGTSFTSFQDASNPNSVLLVIETNDVEWLGRIINDPKNDAIKEKHTVLEPIIISMPLSL